MGGLGGLLGLDNFCHPGVNGGWMSKYRRKVWLNLAMSFHLKKENHGRRKKMGKIDKLHSENELEVLL